MQRFSSRNLHFLNAGLLPPFLEGGGGGGGGVGF